MADEGEDFDAEGAISAYRFIMANLDAASAPEERAEYESMAKRARERWKAWPGEDSLHEMAFG